MTLSLDTFHCTMKKKPCKKEEVQEQNEEVQRKCEIPGVKSIRKLNYVVMLS